MRLRAKSGNGHVASSNAHTLDQRHELDQEHGRLVLPQATNQGLKDMAAGRVLDEAERDEALSPVEKKG